MKLINVQIHSQVLMSSTTKLPKGASKWWNLPAHKMSPEQREIKRQYARELYHKKNKKSDVRALQSENKFLKSIIENYRIDLKDLFDNNNMTTSEIPETATFERYRQIVAEEPVELLGASDSYGTMVAETTLVAETFIALAAGAKIVKIRRNCQCASGGSNGWYYIERNDNGDYSVTGNIKRIADIIYGVWAQGTIKKVEFLHNVDGLENVATMKHGGYHGNYYRLPIPLPFPALVELRIRVTFANDLHLDKWSELPKILLVLECGFINEEIRKELGMGIRIREKDWPAGIPCDEYFCQAIKKNSQ